jgi:plastocyanin
MTTTSRPIRLLLVCALALALVASACGDESTVGSGVKLDKQGEGGALRDPATTTSTPPTTAATTTTAGKAATTTAKPTTTTTAAATVVIKVQDDEQGVAFDPPQVRVRKGSIVEFKNVGTKKARQLKAQNGAFRSPPINPGESWRWTANVVGTHNYADETRPYAVAGQIQVQ